MPPSVRLQHGEMPQTPTPSRLPPSTPSTDCTHHDHATRSTQPRSSECITELLVEAGALVRNALRMIQRVPGGFEPVALRGILDALSADVESANCCLGITATAQSSEVLPSMAQRVDRRSLNGVGISFQNNPAPKVSSPCVASDISSCDSSSSSIESEAEAEAPGRRHMHLSPLLHRTSHFFAEETKDADHQLELSCRTVQDIPTLEEPKCQVSEERSSKPQQAGVVGVVSPKPKQTRLTLSPFVAARQITSRLINPTATKTQEQVASTAISQTGSQSPPPSQYGEISNASNASNQVRQPSSPPQYGEISNASNASNQVRQPSSPLTKESGPPNCVNHLRRPSREIRRQSGWDAIIDIMANSEVREATLRSPTCMTEI